MSSSDTTLVCLLSRKEKSNERMRMKCHSESSHSSSNDGKMIESHQSYRALSLSLSLYIYIHTHTHHITDNLTEEKGKKKEKKGKRNLVLEGLTIHLVKSSKNRELDFRRPFPKISTPPPYSSNTPVQLYHGARFSLSPCVRVHSTLPPFRYARFERRV